MPASARPEPSDLTKEVAAIIKGLMVRRGVEQQKLAAAVGVSPAQMSRMLAGGKHWDIDQLFRATAFLGADFQAVVLDAEQTVAARTDVSPVAQDDTAADEDIDVDLDTEHLSRSDVALAAQRGRRKTDQPHAE
ncbi:helix-turn-helix domain-containing protein [Curtobacterium sp. NPDC087080]|uniref:helix-turn-helix domain-containing protein n=1 Tax=Curtobacterium sp. NPDC087080 TaxID=3363965 RepID=UPI003812577D